MKHLKTLTVLLCVLLAGCGSLSQPVAAMHSPQPLPSVSPTAAPAVESPASTPKLTSSPTLMPTPMPTPTPWPTEISLMAVGDIMFQYHEIRSAYDKATKNYDFNYTFQYIKDYLSSADLTLGNLETTLGGPQYTQGGSLIFSAPDAAADAVKNAGFDVLQTANNHANNKGAAGILRTMQVLDGRGLLHTGIRQKAEDKPYIIVDVKGVKIGMAAYSWCTRPGDNVALDYQKLDKSVKNLVNVFSATTLDKDLADMGKTARQMRADGADIVLYLVHWGAEYRRNPDATQVKMAKALAAAGVDVVIGSHPHWLQTVDVLPNGVTGGKTVVAYSLGNFFSCQRDEFRGQGYNFKYSEDSMILKLKIVRQPGAAASVAKVEYLPTWTFMYTRGGNRCFSVLPLEKAIASPAAYGLTASKAFFNEACDSFNNTQTLLAGVVAKGYLSLAKAD